MGRGISTYKGKSAIVARADLGLVSVDIDLGMPSRTAPAVASYYTVVRPAYGFLVDQLDGSIRLWLSHCNVSSCYRPRSVDDPITPGERSLFVRNEDQSLLAIEIVGYVPRLLCDWVPAGVLWAPGLR